MGYTYSSMFSHVVWSTKDRIAMIDPLFKNRLYDYIGGVVKNTGGVLSSIGGMPDHVHMLIGISTSSSIAKVMQDIKANSSRFVRKNFNQHFAWQTGYGNFNISFSHLNAVKNYISNQEEHHKKISFYDEFIRLLEKHNIAYEKEFLF
jgi:putative transposase